jgi:hypothetical protein
MRVCCDTLQIARYTMPFVVMSAWLPHTAKMCCAWSAPSPDTAAVRAYALQIARYTMPFVVISAIFWLLHTWILDPVPNKFRRREFIRYRREILHVGTKLNFRSPARQVRKRVLFNRQR